MSDGRIPCSQKASRVRSKASSSLSPFPWARICFQAETASLANASRSLGVTMYRNGSATMAAVGSGSCRGLTIRMALPSGTGS